MIVGHDDDMDHDWQRLGKALQATRRARIPKITQEQAAAELGVSRSVIQNIERGIGFTKATPTVREYARRLGWTGGSIDEVLAGGEPTLTEDAPVPGAVEFRGLPSRVKRELEQEGDLVDTAVIQLPGGGTAVVIVKDQPDATPEQREMNLEAWLRTQPALTNLDQVGTEPSQDQ